MWPICETCSEHELRLFATFLNVQGFPKLSTFFRNANLCFGPAFPKYDVRKSFTVPDITVEIKTKFPMYWNITHTSILIAECIMGWPNVMAAHWHVF